MINKIFKSSAILKIFIFIPVIFYFGERSYIAFDEGFYALQARWILDTGNWTIPMWWDEYVLDRTIGLQFLIAKSQEIFGRNMFSAYLPTTIASVIMLFITFKLHEELLGRKHAIISPIILSTTYLWFDYSHLATQDIIYSALVTLGIFSLVKIKSQDDQLYIFLFGIWIGLAFMMKTFLVTVPLLSLCPYLVLKKDSLLTKFFWLGLLSGFIPFLIWTVSVNSFLDQNIIFYLYQKLNSLSSKNTFTNPFYYYFWNIPVTFLPWSIFAFIGTIHNFSKNQNQRFFLTIFPLVLISILSIFSTKTPYYPLQIASILSLNSYVGIKYLFSSRKYNSIFIFVTSKIIPLTVFTLIFIYYFSLEKIINFNYKENIFLFLGLILFCLSWSFINSKRTFNKFLVPLILGPYLLTSSLLQSGLFTDRSRELREAMEYVSSVEKIKNQTIRVDKSGIDNSETGSKIIKISLLTPNLGKAVKNISDLNQKELVWSTESKEKIEKNNFYTIIYENEKLNPWKLIKKN